MKKMIIWFLSWALFVLGMLFVVVIFLGDDYHNYQTGFLIALAATLPRLLSTAFNLAENVWTFSVFGLIAPAIVATGVFWTANLAFPGYWQLIMVIELAVFAIVFFAGLIKHRLWLKAWVENAQKVLEETKTAKRIIREG